jgi:hypothetical protein
MRYFAIGDIHGHYDEMMQLMYQLQDKAKLNFKEDVVVFLGDVVDGGPDVKKVISQMRKYKMSFPGDLTFKAWQGVLKDIENGFLAHKKIDEINFPVKNYLKNLEKLEKARNKGLALFIKYYQHLWD